MMAPRAPISIAISSANWPKLDLAYLHLFHFGDEALLKDLRDLWPNALLLVRPGRTREQIGEAVASGIADIEPIGTFALANPDLVDRLKSDAELNTADRSTFFGGGEAGYTDYPTARRARGCRIGGEMQDEAAADADPCAVEPGACEAAEAGLAGHFPVSCAIVALARSHRRHGGLAPRRSRPASRPGADADAALGQGRPVAEGALRRARLDHSTIAKSLRRLEEAGLLTRCKSGEDGRISLVNLTEAGRALRERTHAAWAELEARTVAGPLRRGTRQLHRAGPPARP